MVFRTRFAPSPTGRLHMGNIRTALICWYYARKSNGECILRIDDTDQIRSDATLIEAIKSDLSWMGLDFDSCFQQSDRFDRYNEVVENLRYKGLLYPCYETRDELETARKLLLKRKLPPIYRHGFDGIPRPDSDGRQSYWRFAVNDEMAVSWHDEVKGVISFDPHNLSDPIVIREDGTYTYMLPSVIDDIDRKITHVVRGDDHISNTAMQIQMFKVLGSEVPNFAHLSLLRDAIATKLSKRLGSNNLDYMRSIGITAEAITSYLLSLGSSRPQVLDAGQFINEFNISQYSSGSCIFSMDGLIRTNRTMLHKLEFEHVRSHFPNLLQNSDESLWNVARNNINTVSEFAEWRKCFVGSAVNCILSEEDNKVISAAHDIFTNLYDWDEHHIRDAMSAIKTIAHSKRTIPILRKVITGLDSGPEMVHILFVMGRSNVLARLRDATNNV